MIEHAKKISSESEGLHLRRVSAYRGLRVLAWDREVLYASRGYQLLCMYSEQLRATNGEEWKLVASFQPAWWRNLTSRHRLSSRLMRDGFHTLAILDDQTMIAVVPGFIATRPPASDNFQLTHVISRGTRPLHITAVPGGNVYWGEYFDNRERAEVHIYASADRGRTWQIAHTFSAGAIRHIHNVVYDQWADCLWILTGDEGAECKVLWASCDLRSVETVLVGSQQARAVAAIPTKEAVFLSTDTPFEQNHILRLDRKGSVEAVGDLANSSIFGCRNANALFFSTMAEPSPVNSTREVHLAGSADGTNWQVLARWKKDRFPMRYFQYGNVILPDGENTTKLLAATTIAVDRDDLLATIWEVETCLRTEG